LNFKNDTSINPCPLCLIKGVNSLLTASEKDAAKGVAYCDMQGTIDLHDLSLTYNDGISHDSKELAASIRYVAFLRQPFQNILSIWRRKLLSRELPLALLMASVYCPIGMNESEGERQ
jgi:hypothetical protein